MKKISTFVLVLALGGAALAQNEKAKPRVVSFAVNASDKAVALLQQQRYAEINETWLAQSQAATARMRASGELKADEQIVDVGTLEVSNNGGAWTAVATGGASPWTLSGNNVILASSSYGPTYLASATSLSGTVTYHLRAPDSSDSTGHNLSIRGGTGTGAGGGAVTIAGGPAALNFAGGSVLLSPANGAGSGNGGPLTGTAGSGGSTGAGGDVTFTSGAGGGTSGPSGNVTISTGSTTDGATGSLAVSSSNATGTNRSTGSVTVSCGTPTGSGTRGQFKVSSTRFQAAAGTSTAAANDLTLPSDGNTVHITGNTTINAITTTAWQAGSVVRLIFDGTPTVKNNTAGGAGTAVMLLAGGADFSATANDVLTLVYDGTSWFECSRSVN